MCPQLYKLPHDALSVLDTAARESQNRILVTFLRVVAMLIFPIVESLKHNFRAVSGGMASVSNFFKNLSSLSGVQSRRQTDRQTDMAVVHAFISRTLCKERIITLKNYLKQ